MRLPQLPRATSAALAGVFLTIVVRGFAAEATTESKPAPNDPVARIRDEGMNRSQIMPTLLALTDLNGSRLTGSPGLRRAIESTQRRLESWGLANVHAEPWNGFERGWALRGFSLQAFTPEATPVIALPKAWSPGVP
ncbi:MAG: hypothetical protein ACKODK_17715, partial [Opitutaceae bacterium]